MKNKDLTQEELRLRESAARKSHWKRWGPYLSERAWGTVREDYSRDGTAWDYFPYEHARSRVYRWNEDGLLGICDRHQYICFSIALWNGQDPTLKERLFGLAGNQGNHGEDVKEYYFYLDNTPTHSYMKALYKYPHRAFPYQKLLDENRKRSRQDPEFELIDTGVFANNGYFDVAVEYAKNASEDILIEITIANRAPVPAPLHLLPTIWFRNTWSWGLDDYRPSLRKMDDYRGASVIEVNHAAYGFRYLYCDQAPPVLFTENETNYARVFNSPNQQPYVKDAFHEYVVNKRANAVNPASQGTKAAAIYELVVPAASMVSFRLRLTPDAPDALPEPFGSRFTAIFQSRKQEADAFYETVVPEGITEDGRQIMRQSLAGMLWSKQFYNYEVRRWLLGDPNQPPPPPERLHGRNSDWMHLYNSDVISMPDKWEYPWYAAWDLAFHCIPLSLVDPDFAKEQLILLLREWYMHPSGKIPAYEWCFDDVNPPVHAWAALRVYKIEKKRKGCGDRAFLQRVFHKLLLNFTWWVNRKDSEGNNIFQGGFLGLDNIGVFDRNTAVPTGGMLEQSDGTSWMAMYSLNLMNIALELAREDPAYEDVASKFWEHFIYIADAMNNRGNDIGMWNEEDGFFYDVLHHSDGSHFPLRVRSLVGLIPLFAVETLEPELLQRLPGFKRRLEWFVENRPDLTANIASMTVPGKGDRRLLSIADPKKLRQILKVMLDENEFLSPYGIRGLSRFHRDHPFCMELDGQQHCVDYEPGESRSGTFGGNSNWRGPIWFSVNYLLIESLQKFHHYLGDEFTVEFPTGSGKMMTLSEVAHALSIRLTRLFLRNESGKRPVFGDREYFQTDPHWRDLIPFYEFFHGDTGQGLGASHQTGWTGLIAKLLQQIDCGYRPEARSGKWKAMEESPA